MITNRQKALIHVAKQRIGMSEDEYRAMLSGFGARSSTELDQARFEAVMAHFKKCGFRSRVRQPAAPARRPATSRELLRRKVRAILRDMGLTDSYADAIARSRFGVDAWGWLKADELLSLVAMLTYHQRRHPERRHERRP